MIRMFPRRRTEIAVAAGEDGVLFGISLPSECRLNNLSAEVHLLDTSIVSRLIARFYAVDGYILPVLDPDSSPSYDTIWDTLVPKDNDTDTIDLDTQASDIQSFYEPGESAMSEIMDVGLQPERIFNMQRMRSFANSVFKKEEAGVLEWSMSDVVKIKIRKRYFVKQPSVVVFALGNPDLTDTTTNIDLALAENEWARVKYMELVLEQALMKHFGLVEATAETPWEEAAALLRKYIEPDVYEQDAGAFGSSVLRAFSTATFDVSVPGTMGKIQIGSGG